MMITHQETCMDINKKIAAESLLEFSLGKGIWGNTDTRGFNSQTVAKTTSSSESNCSTQENLSYVPRVLMDLNTHRPIPESGALYSSNGNNVEKWSVPSHSEHYNCSGANRRPPKRLQHTDIIGATPPNFNVEKCRKMAKNTTEKDCQIKKLHVCSYEDCQKVYGKSSHLKAHIRTHTG